MSRNHANLNPKLWAKVRRQAFERDGYRCTECGNAGRLEAHHKAPLRAGGDSYDLAGIATLCRNCHIARHRPDDMVAGRMEWCVFVSEFLDH